MQLIVGLGNPGTLYQHTRHNIGFLFVDYLAHQKSLPAFKTYPTLHGSLTKNPSLTLLKPDTYMNESGRSVTATLSYFKIPLENLIVVHDDVDIPFGEFKIHHDRGHAGHNGIRSIHEHLKTSTYTRIRIGVRNPTHDGLKALAFVLSPFTNEERAKLPEIFEKILHELP